MSQQLAVLEIETKKLELETGRFELEQRRAKALSVSAFFPTALKNDIASAVQIYDLSQRMNISVLEVAQSVYLIHGKPSFATTFLVARLNQSGLIIGSLRTVISKDKQSAHCVALDATTGEEMVGMTVTMAIAHAEGWIKKAGSKWQTMPELMLRKRCQSFFIKEYYPEVMFGMQTKEEVEDITNIIDTEMTPTATLNEAIFNKKPQEATPNKAEQFDEVSGELVEVAKPIVKRMPRYISKYYKALENYGVKKNHMKSFVEFMNWLNMAETDISAFFSHGVNVKNSVDKFYGVEPTPMDEDAVEAQYEESSSQKPQETSQATMETEMPTSTPKAEGSLSKYNGMFISRGIAHKDIPTFLKWAGVNEENIVSFVEDVEGLNLMVEQFLQEENYAD